VALIVMSSQGMDGTFHTGHIKCQALCEAPHCCRCSHCCCEEQVGGSGVSDGQRAGELGPRRESPRVISGGRQHGQWEPGGGLTLQD
jgi:hypothetical protein